MKSDTVSSKVKAPVESNELSDQVWKVASNADLVAQALYVYGVNQRKGTANAKTRAEVTGGGKKPWKHKGTGRARQGSIRSPLWVKGGVAFPPRSHKTMLNMSKQMKHKAICCALSDLMRSERVRIVPSFDVIKEGKTKELNTFVDEIESKNTSVLFIARKEDNWEKLSRAVRNNDKAVISDPFNVNIFDVVNAGVIVSVPGAVQVLEKRLLQK